MCLTWRRKRMTQKMMKNMMARKASHVPHLAQEEEEKEDEEYDGQDDGEGKPCVSLGAGRGRHRR